MRSFKFVMLAVLAAGIVAMPAMAGDAVSSQQAVKMLQQAMGPAKSLSSGDKADIMAAFTHATGQNPDLLQELATLIAVARPDLVTDLKSTIQLIRPELAQQIIDQMEQASINPSVDQLAALANLEGAAPASGDPNVSSGSETAESEDPNDLGWAGYVPGNGSQD